MLHEVSTGALNAYHVTEQIRKLIDRDTFFIESEVNSIDAHKKIISLKNKDINYDILVIALGSKTNYFHTPGAEKYSYTLKTLKDAKKLRNHFIEKFEKASCIDDKKKKKQMLTFAIIGGGPTGVELAAEAAELLFDTFHKYYSNVIDFNDVSLVLINSGNVLLRPFSSKYQKYAEKVLRNKKVKILNNTRVTEIKENSIIVRV